ncbi:methylated-DNA--[protein]-cysteine S-methyltransferase [Clostridium aestuarii]|uniref:Methylated-DNA--protein-cysteine methyltransferase n=1 Tax=Clostridium aestuarii TaxID=338193 RepID=A0ABT4D436_9CLOT|nr:methylated-DNA--[protein]-cysteine S-methyltransferase [Clostridium aestuarii]MCY6485015.1 methylated-DNA--[protein]-cysteine S-methyltransferase [Clostridium aestuarii]
MDKVYKAYYKSPIGVIEIKGTEKGILSVICSEKIESFGDVPLPLKEAYAQLDEYFKGKRKEFSLNLLMEGTEFQKKVWNELAKISYAKTVSYKYIAEAIGDGKACRAVGSANGKNKFWIILPCHRVIGSNGKLTGYAGGIWRKEWLLNHEKQFS